MSAPPYNNPSPSSSENRQPEADDSQPLPLSDVHRDMLVKESGIAEDIIRERVYRTTNDPAVLTQYGFSQPQRRLGAGLLIPMFAVTGQPSSAQFRPDHPRCNREGKLIKYETPQGSTMSLDVLPRHVEAIRNPEIPLWITEGLKKGDALSSHGACAIPLIGVWNWKGRNQYGGSTTLADWDFIALKNREVILAFDNDYRENASVLLALHRLSAFLRHREAQVSYINLPAGPKMGVDDYLAQGKSLDDLLAMKTDTLPEIPKQTQAEALLSIADSRLTLICTRDGDRLATATYADGHREVYSIGERGSSLRNWLIMEYCQAHHPRLPSPSALSQVMEIISAACWRSGQHVDIFTRTAYDGRTLYLDLATPTWEAVEVDANGWREVKRPPVYFRRPPGMLPLPMPLHGGSLSAITDLLNLDAGSNEAMLIQGWLIGTLHRDGPYPHLNLQGQQGSGKTTATKMLRGLIDPNTSPTRRQPKEEEDLVLAAMNGHIVGIENVSGLPLWLSDTLCGLSTGSGLSRRRKYSDSDESLFYAKRPAIINGITQVATRGDLIDRLISVELPSIAPQSRKRETEIWEQFEQKRPFILGALLDAVSTAIRRQDNVVITELPRMADFAHWVEAAAPSLGWKEGQFLKVFNEQKEEAVEVEIEASPVAVALLAYLQEYKEISAASAADILLCLEPYHTHQGTKRPAKAWPERAEGLAHALIRIAPAMRQRGYTVEQIPRSGRDGRRWKVLPILDGDGLNPSNLPNRHQNAKPTPKPSPNNPLNNQNLDENNPNGVGCDGLNSLYSVRMPDQNEKNILTHTLIDKGGKQPSQPSQPSPLPSDNTHLNSDRDADDRVTERF